MAILLIQDCETADEIQLLQDPSIGPDRVDLPRNELPARHQGVLHSRLDPAAARDLHADNGHALDLVVADDLGELLGVVHGIQLRTSDECHMSVDEIVVEVSVCVGGAVRGNEELRTVKVRGADRGELDLDRPLGESALHGDRCGVPRDRCAVGCRLRQAWVIVRLMVPGHPVNSGFGDRGASVGMPGKQPFSRPCVPETASWS